MAFTTPYDIANRALQHVGVPRISTFADSSPQAAESAFCYDKLRRAELRRFVWTCATKRAVLRPITTATVKNAVFPAYSGATTYNAGDIVKYTDGGLYISVAGSNTGNVPTTPTGPNPGWEAYFGPLVADTWSSALTYLPGDLVVASGVLYLAIGQSTNQTPPNATYWYAPAGATVSALFNYWPQGYNPAGTTQRTVYRLPNNYLRIAPQDPKAAAVARLNTTAGMQFNDWEIEGPYLSSVVTTGGIVFRFVADIIDVAAMDDMFCEALAARMALELNERFTQDPNKAQLIGGLYNRAVTTARTVSAIEAGTTEDDIEQAGQPASAGVPAGAR